MLVKTSYVQYKNDPISFGAETTYLDWDTKFPTIALCEGDNADRIADYTDKYALIFYRDFLGFPS